MAKYAKSKDSIVYYSQRNNYGSPNSECFPTSMTMVMRNNMRDVDPTLKSFMVDDLFDHYIEIMERSKDAKYYWTIEEKRAEEYLRKSEVLSKQMHKLVNYIEGASSKTIQSEIDRGYMVVLGTKQLGGLPGGHIVAMGGYDDEHFYLWDPFGDYRTSYANHSGKDIKIKKDHPAITTRVVGPDKYRIMIVRSDGSKIV